MAAALRMFQLADLVREWRLRLTSLRSSLREAPNSERWLGEIRLRILTFLLSRYEERSDPTPIVPGEPAPTDPLLNSRFDLPELTPEYVGPRASAQLRRRLLDIQRQQVAKPRWRFWP